MTPPRSIETAPTLFYPGSPHITGLLSLETAILRTLEAVTRLPPHSPPLLTVRSFAESHCLQLLPKVLLRFVSYRLEVPDNIS